MILDHIDKPLMKELKSRSNELERLWWGFVPKPKSWDERVTKPIEKQHRVSICTTCMDRLFDLKETLPKNIEDNLDYVPHVEFVLLDYNSSDKLGEWVRDTMMKYIEEGILVYYRTDEPRFYTMAHSRNVAFKLATGHIVNNVDADGFTKKGFASFINVMANQREEKVVFAKSNQLLRGRMGFYRSEFIELLGGYDESMQGYGFDDRDLMYRAWALGFVPYMFRGKYFGKTDTQPDTGENYDKERVEKHWKYTQHTNKLISFANLFSGKFKANEGKHWGKVQVVKNFSETIEI